ncbi:MAG TPA: right-handed parallel beta-helix repeat-containing protein [Tepidisphaeraceae bacterium]|jgi:hypothetical protein|nr:right-handed parallel beta-helix repeat-containing protein [Tepidisphaeraceae bacterium]
MQQRYPIIIKHDDTKDAVTRIRKAIAATPAGAPLDLTFEQGTHAFQYERAAEQFCFIANNDEGLKRIAIHVADRDGVTIDGNGSNFCTHGTVMPVLIERCRNVTLKNFTLDAASPFHCEAIVLASHDDGVDVEIPEGFPFEIVYGRLRLSMRGRASWEVDNILEFDAARRETAYKVVDHYRIGQQLRVTEIGPRQLRFTAPFRGPRRPQVGNVLVLTGFGRHYPGIVLSDCTNVSIENVTIHQAGGMGVLAQGCDGVRLNRVRVTPSGGRMISTYADATHFVGCRGLIEIEDCIFENQMDDPLNIHGVYATITRRVARDAVEVKLNHGQQLGFNIARIGDRMELVRNTTLLTYHEAIVTNVDRINKEYVVVTFDGALPPDVRMSDAVGNLTWTPDVTIRRCVSRGNRARGFLVTTPGRVLIEDNYFHTPGPAVLITGDANYWFESGAVRDVTIRNNEFDNCNYGVWGTGAIEFHPEVKPEHRNDRPYHRNVTIEDNRFIAFDPRLVTGWGVDGITIRGNTIIPSTAYAKPSDVSDEPFQLKDCRNVTIEDNVTLQSRTEITREPEPVA